jgi:hypothetical protein
MNYTVNLEINGQPNIKKLTNQDINKLVRLFDRLPDQTTELDTLENKHTRAVLKVIKA